MKRKSTAFFLVIVLVFGLFASSTSAASGEAEEWGQNDDYSITTSASALTTSGAAIQSFRAFNNITAANFIGEGKFLAPIEQPESDVNYIRTAQDLVNIKNDMGGTYVLLNDIDLSTYNGGEWQPIGDINTPFTGRFDGIGHVIRNLKITGNGYVYNGLFGYANSAYILNIGIENCTIDIKCSDKSRIFTGGICGDNLDGNIYNCYVEGRIAVESNGVWAYVGGICASSSGGGRVERCYNTADIYAKGGASSASGMGDADNIYDCFNSGSINAASSDNGDRSSAGGITVGSGNIQGCYNIGDIIANSRQLAFAGGITSGMGDGYSGSGGHISSSYNRGDVYAESSSPFNRARAYAGGISGYERHDAYISDTYNTGNIRYDINDGDFTDHVGFVGGIVGYALDDSKVYNNIQIKNSYFINGLVSAGVGGSTGVGFLTDESQSIDADSLRVLAGNGLLDADNINANDGFPILEWQNHRYESDIVILIDNVINTRLSFYDGAVSENNCSVDVVWHDEWLRSDAGYNNSLAKAAAILTASAGSQNAITSNLEKLGFTIHPNSSELMGQNPKHIFGYKTVYNSDNEYENIFITIVNGTDYWLDAGTDITTGIDHHLGFDEIADGCLKQLDAYVDMVNKSTQVTKEKHFLTGHSLGAAVTNIMAATLTKEGKDVLAYTFATPNVATTSYIDNTWGAGNNFTNIFNIVNQRDGVTGTPSWMWKPGLTFVVPDVNLLSDDASDKASTNRIAFNVKFQEITQSGKTYADSIPVLSTKRIPNSVHHMVCYLTWLSVSEPSRWEVTKGSYINRAITARCPVDINIYDSEGILIRQISDNDSPVYADDVYTFTDGDIKHIYLPGYDNYSLEFIGTGLGEMQYEVNDYEFGTGELISTKNFNNVNLDEGKLMNSAIGADAEAVDVKLFVLSSDKKERVSEVQPDGTETPITSPAQPTTYTITATAGAGGTVSGGGTYTSGATVSLEAAPNSNYTFNGWYEDGVRIAGANATYTFEATRNRILDARFTYTPPSNGNDNNNDDDDNGSNNRGENRREPSRTPQPSIWPGVRDQIGRTKPGDTVTIATNGATSVPAYIFSEIKGKDITLALNIGSYAWAINGLTVQDIPASPVSYNLWARKITNKALSELAGNKDIALLELTHKGALPFTAVLEWTLGVNYKDSASFLYHYNEATNAFEYKADVLADNTGKVRLSVSSGSRHALVSEKLAEAAVELSEPPITEETESVPEPTPRPTQEPTPQPAPAPIIPQGPTQLVLSESMPADEYGFKPFIFRSLESTGYKYGLIKVNELIQFFDAQSTWDNATGTATITGTDRSGTPIEIILTNNSSTLTVNGVTYDIAEYAGAPELSGLYTIYNAGGALYLPCRAVANAFGATLEWQNETSTAIIYK